MTPEQEQLVVQMLLKLPEMDERVRWKVEITGYMPCLFCDYPYDATHDAYTHEQGCILVLAEQLRKTVGGKE